jgi:hypothetical protein
LSLFSIKAPKSFHGSPAAAPDANDANNDDGFPYQVNKGPTR